MKALTGEAYNKLFLDFQKSPSFYFKEILNVTTLEEYQEKILQAVAENERVCIKACHDLGKTYTMARIVIWLLNCFPNCKIITTAPTFNQVQNILWAEIRGAVGKSKYKLGGDLNLTEWRIDHEWFALGFTPKSEVSDGAGQGTQSSFQGFHAEGGLFLVFDEATGIAKQIWDMAEGLLTQHFVKFVAIGNPTSTSSEFYNCFRSAAWKKISLTCFDSPNLIANKITDKEKLREEVNLVKSLSDDEAQARMKSYLAPKPYLLSLKWVVSAIIKWGFDHPLTVSKIFGEFPEADDKSLVSLHTIEQAQSRTYISKVTDRKTIGVDVARFGSDSTVITIMHGKKVIRRIELFKNDTTQIVGEILALLHFEHYDVVVVDETGLGAGVVDLLKEKLREGIINNVEIRGVQFGAKANSGDPTVDPSVDDDNKMYYNMKARMFGLLRDDLKNEIELPQNESIYAEEIPTIRFSYNSKGQMVIESKDEYKKRTTRKSPDSADSLALANFGNYDTLTVGKFDKGHNANVPKPMASGLRSGGREW